MSSTRRSASGLFHQERFCSSPEFDGDTINGVAAAKRISIVKDQRSREILWWVQWRSLAPAGLQQLCGELLSAFPGRIGPPTLRKWRKTGKRNLETSELLKLREEIGLCDAATLAALTDRDHEQQNDIPIGEHDRSFYEAEVTRAVDGFSDDLKKFCLDPSADLAAGLWYFEDLLGALALLRERGIDAARSRLAATEASQTINETLDFWYARRRMILIEGVAGIGRSATTRAWCDAHAGLVRFVEIPSSSDDRSLYASVARELGVARGASFNGQQIKVRVEEMLATSGLMLACDESQYLWGNAIRQRKTPDRLLWIKTLFDAGTPIALIAHTDFTKWEALYIDKTQWSDEQFERRLNRRVLLPAHHSAADMLKIARAHLPGGDMRTWKLLASYALGTEKKQASGIVEALESARYRAERAGRSEAEFADIEAALIHDHGFLNPPLAAPLQSTSTTSANRMKHGHRVREVRPTSRFHSMDLTTRRTSGGHTKRPVAT